MITAPYNFVPLNKHIYLPDWADQISHDIPFEDGKDGYIEVTWENVSPLCIRDASTGDDGYSMHVKQPDGSRLYFLPGSSLRGMLRNTLNILAFGKMEQYDNRFFGERDFGTVPNEEFGWLYLKGDEYVLCECEEPVSQILISEVESLIGEKYDRRGSKAWERNVKIRDSSYGKKHLTKENILFPIIEQGGKEYALFATGWMAGKLYELLIPTQTTREIPLRSELKESFLKIYKRKDTGASSFFDEMLDKEKRIPVSFIKDNDGGIKALGLSHMIRRPYKHSVRDLVNKEQKRPECVDADGKVKVKRDLSDAIFGWVDGNSCQKGRVQICNAYAEYGTQEKELVKGVLGEPKASFYPLYLKQQEGGQYKNYDSDDALISGRKLYRVHEGSGPMDLPQGNGNAKIENKFRPIPAGNFFKMRINVHNLRKVEIGALLSAITFHETSGVFHNIGSAKGFGYGKLKCVALNLHLQGLNSGKEDKEDYLKAFEMEMDKFVKSSFKCNWVDTPQIIRMMAIMSEHTPQQVRMMVLEDYTREKNEKRVSLDASFREKKMVHSCFEKERKLEKCYPAYEEDKVIVNEFLDFQMWEEAKNALEKMLDKLTKNDIDDAWVKGQLESVKREIGMQIVVNKIKLIQQKIIKESRNLYARLNERYDQNVNKGEYKVQTWKVCADIVKKWTGKKPKNELDDEERDGLEKVIRRLAEHPDRREQREWDSYGSKIWKQIKEYLGEERAGKLFEELKK